MAASFRCPVLPVRLTSIDTRAGYVPPFLGVEGAGLGTLGTLIPGKP